MKKKRKSWWKGYGTGKKSEYKPFQTSSHFYTPSNPASLRKMKFSNFYKQQNEQPNVGIQIRDFSPSASPSPSTEYTTGVIAYISNVKLELNWEKLIDLAEVVYETAEAPELSFYEACKKVRAEAKNSPAGFLAEFFLSLYRRKEEGELIPPDLLKRIEKFFEMRQQENQLREGKTI